MTDPATLNGTGALRFKPKAGKSGLPCTWTKACNRSGRFIAFLASWPMLDHHGAAMVVCKGCQQEMIEVYEGALGAVERELVAA